jgi:hypothetical protein
MIYDVTYSDLTGSWFGREGNSTMGLLSWLFGRDSEPVRNQDDGFIHRNIEQVAAPRNAEQRPVPTPFDAPRGKHASVQWRAGSFPMEVVGESRYQNALVAICGAHTRYGHDSEYSANIEREPLNPFDRNAVVAKIGGRTVGYLSREQAVRVSEQMISDGIFSASCKARVRGGWRTNQYDEGHYGVWLAIPNWGWIDFGIGASPSIDGVPNVPRKASTRPEPSQTGSLVGEWVALIGATDDGDLAKQLARNGAKIMAGVGKFTTLLVVAEERPFTPGLVGSSRYRQAQDLIKAGRLLRIVSLSEAREMMGAFP